MGGSATSTTLSGAFQHVFSSGTANRTTINSDDQQQVSGVTTSTTISGSTQDLWSDSATSTTINGGQAWLKKLATSSLSNQSSSLFGLAVNDSGRAKSDHDDLTLNLIHEKGGPIDFEMASASGRSTRFVEAGTCMYILYSQQNKDGLNGGNFWPLRAMGVVGRTPAAITLVNDVSYVPLQQSLRHQQTAY